LFGSRSYGHLAEDVLSGLEGLNGKRDTQESPFCIAGMTCSVPILAVLRIPQRTLFWESAGIGRSLDTPPNLPRLRKTKNYKLLVRLKKRKQLAQSFFL